MPQNEIDTFVRTIEYTRSLSSTARALNGITTGAFDVSDMYRAALAQAVSAFDFFIHEEVRVRMVNLHLSGDATKFPGAFERYEISSSGLHMMRAKGVTFDSAVWFENEIKRQHAHLSFQNAAKVADACRLVCRSSLWNEVALDLGVQAQGRGRGRIDAGVVLKNEWNLIIDRRNLIVHEADYDPTPPRVHRYPITATDADQAIDKVEAVGLAIGRVLAR